MKREALQKILEIVAQDIKAELAEDMKDIKIYAGRRDWQFDTNGNLIGAGCMMV